MNRVLSVGELGVSNQMGETIMTYSLGSCVAVMMFDQQTGAVGMAHVALPDSCIDECLSRKKPGYFANTAIPHLLEEMKKLDEGGNDRGITVKLVGGSTIMAPNNTFNIGKRNLIAIKNLLQDFGMTHSGEDVGGTISRTVTISVGTKKVMLSSPGEDDWEV